MFSKFKISGSLFVLIGIVISVNAVNNFFYNQYFVKNAISTTGVVIEIKSYKKKKIFAPIYKYNDQNYIEHKSTSYFSSDPEKYKVGQSIEVLFDPKNSSYSKIKDNFRPWAGSVMPFFIGIIICLIGGIVFKSGRSENHSL